MPSDAPTTRTAKPAPKTIELTDLGPVERLTLPLPEPGGVVILRGRNDVGKSKALEATARLLGGADHVEARDRCAFGQIEGLGVRLRVAKTPRKTGELEAVSIDGQLSIADLVDPRIADPDRADVQRIRALVALSGAKADLDQFAALLPGGKDEALAIFAEETTKATDLLEMAARVKRDLEREARTQAAAASNAEAEAAALRNKPEELDLTAEADADTLRDRLMNAVGRRAQITHQATVAAEAATRAQEASQRLDQEAATYQGPTAEEAETFLETSHDEEGIASQLLLEAEAAVHNAGRRFANAQTDRKAAEAGLAAAKDHERVVATCRATIASLSNVPAPKPGDATAADAAVQAAQAAADRGALIREQRRKEREAAALDERAAKAREAASSYRDSAKATDDLLSQAVDSPRFSIKAGRLMTQHDGRGEVPYHDRSTGTRWKLAIAEAAEKARKLHPGERVLIPVPQEAWESLDPQNRRDVADHCKALGVVLFTAEATDGKLRAEVFGASNAELAS
jgi:hypothetical protein